MVKIQRDTKIDNNELSKLIIKYGETTVSLDRSSIEYEIDRLSGLEAETKNEKTKINLRRTIKYLKELSKRAAKGKIDIRLYSDRHKISSIPIEVVRIPEFNVNTVDFVVADGKTLVNIDYDNAISAILFEACYMDLGYSLEDIEERLESVNIITRNKPAELIDMMDGLNFREILHMRMEECTWITSDDTKKCVNYFGETIVCNKMYEPLALDLSRKFLNRVVYDLCKNKLSSMNGASIIGVYDTNIDILVKDLRDLNVFEEEIVINIFGRKFDFKPKITTL